MQAKSIKISTTLMACTNLRNELEMAINLYQLDEQYKDFVIKILRKLNNAIIRHTQYHTLCLTFTNCQARKLQEFVLQKQRNKQGQPYFLNKADIFKPYET